MIAKIFPYKLQLQIFQQSEYRITNFLKWIVNNFFKRKIEDKKKLYFSIKAKTILALSIGLDLLVIVILSIYFGFIGLVLGIIVSTQSYLFLVASALILKPFEMIRRFQLKTNAIKKLSKYKALTVIGITGSYAKTSVKEFLYQILKTEYQVLKTPQSYNTVLGIAKVIDLELDGTYQYFVCEMAAYKRGEIKELTQMLKPKHGILTGINEQHLELFGSIENTILAKFELIDALPENGIAIINGGNDLIKENVKKYQRNFVVYGLGDFKFTAKNIKITESRTSFDLILDGKSYPCQTSLAGRSQVENIVAASAMAFKLGVYPEKIVDAVKNLSPVPHRLELKFSKNALIIDDAYNSNVTGFKEALNLLGSFKNKEKVLVTPGIVDLGVLTLKAHRQLGELAGKICDAVVLVGKSDRTYGLSQGINSQGKTHWVNSIKELPEILKKLNLKNPVILLENDLPDNY